VATVKPNGAAQMAGVRQGDRILKVNGMLVSGDNFQEVIKMISGQYFYSNIYCIFSNLKYLKIKKYKTFLYI